MEAFTRVLDGRAWTHAEGPVALFEHATGWLRRNKVLLPGVTVLARQVAAAREAAEARLYEALRVGHSRRCTVYRSGSRNYSRFQTGREFLRWNGCGNPRGELRAGDGQGPAACRADLGAGRGPRRR